MFKDFKLNLSGNVKELYQNKIWDIQRNNPNYQRFEITLSQTINRFINDLEKFLKQHFKCGRVVYNREDLCINNSFFHGKGKCPDGWKNFNEIKSENRFLISSFCPHGART